MRCRRARATYPQTRWATSSSAYLVLLRVEIGRFTPSPCGEGIVTVPLILTSRWTGVTRYAALRSPDFPLHRKRCSDRLACFTPTFSHGSGCGHRRTPPAPYPHANPECPAPATAPSPWEKETSTDRR